MRRLGCGVALVLWFGVLLLPCFCFVLAAQGEITVSLSDVPGNTFRIWLVNEANERGIGISKPILRTTGDANSVCVQTDVSFILWQGEGTPNHYCDCYTRPHEGTDWTSTSTTQGSCAA